MTLRAATTPAQTESRQHKCVTRIIVRSSLTIARAVLIAPRSKAAVAASSPMRSPETKLSPVGTRSPRRATPITSPIWREVLMTPDAIPACVLGAASTLAAGLSTAGESRPRSGGDLDCSTE